MSGTQDIVIAGGVEVMSIVPIGASITDGMNAGMVFHLMLRELKKDTQEFSSHNLLELSLLQISGIYQERIWINLPLKAT